jgi:hypothetical protein
MFDFNVADKTEAHKYIIKKIGQPTAFWKFVADPKEPIRVTLEVSDAKSFSSKSDAKKFMRDNDLDKKGFEVKEVDPDV